MSHCRRLSGPALVIVSSGLALLGTSAMPSNLQAAEAEWVDLFDGSSLEGWRANESPSTFRVEEGTIVAGGPRSHLFYEGSVASHEFRDFDFACEVKTEPGSNSGVIIHTGFETTGWCKRGYEVQINNSYVAKEGRREMRKTGSLFGVRNLYASGVRDGEWFSLEISVRGKRIRVSVAGKAVVDYLEPPLPPRPKEWQGRVLSRGTFALQCHDEGSRVFFRRLRVRPLPPAPEEKDPRGTEELARDREITELHAMGFPLIDYHAHLKGGLTMNEVLERTRALGITYGVAVNAGVGFPVTDDAALAKSLESIAGWPIFRAVQAEGREWRKMFSPKAIGEFDYVFTDSMTFVDDAGRRTRLWIPEEVHIDDEQAFVDMVVARTVEILEKEPIDIYVNPTFLPDSLAARHAELWTPERIERVVQAAVKNQVAIEINSRYKLPSRAFIERAKKAGAKFSFGTNNGGKELGPLDYSLEMVRACGITKDDIFYPRPHGEERPTKRER